MKIALRSVAPHLRQEASQADHLATLASLDPDCPHGLTGDPEAADAILLTDAPGGPWLARALLLDPWVRAYWDRIFLYSEDPRPFRPLPGVYTSHPRTRDDDRLSRAMAYPCWTGALNPGIDQGAEAPPSREPDLLYSFMGRRSHPVRRRLFEMSHPREAAWVEDTTGTYRHLAGKADQRRDAERSYVDVALRSRFALCPAGWATSTVRLYEMMALGVAPVVLADRWVPPTGPRWERFVTFVPEEDVTRLPDILREREDEWRVLGDEAFTAFRTFFSPERQFRTMADALEELVPTSGWAREHLRRRWPMTLPAMVAVDALRGLGRLVTR